MEAMNSNSICRAESIINSMANGATIKRVKRDRGLMERSDSEQKIILEEDNRQVIFG